MISYVYMIKDIGVVACHGHIFPKASIQSVMLALFSRTSYERLWWPSKMDFSPESSDSSPQSSISRPSSDLRWASLWKTCRWRFRSLATSGIRLTEVWFQKLIKKERCRTNNVSFLSGCFVHFFSDACIIYTTQKDLGRRTCSPSSPGYTCVLFKSRPPTYSAETMVLNQGLHSI